MIINKNINNNALINIQLKFLEFLKLATKQNKRILILKRDKLWTRTLIYVRF